MSSVNFYWDSMAGIIHRQNGDWTSRLEAVSFTGKTFVRIWKLISISMVAEILLVILIRFGFFALAFVALSTVWAKLSSTLTWHFLKVLIDWKLNFIETWLTCFSFSRSSLWISNDDVSHDFVHLGRKLSWWFVFFWLQRFMQICDEIVSLTGNSIQTFVWPHIIHSVAITA